jgi:hypothetical protein
MVCDNVSVIAGLGSLQFYSPFECVHGCILAKAQVFNLNIFIPAHSIKFRQPLVSRCPAATHTPSFFFKPAFQGYYLMCREDGKGTKARRVQFRMSFDIQYRIEDKFLRKEIRLTLYPKSIFASRVIILTSQYHHMPTCAPELSVKENLESISGYCTVFG